MYSHVSTFAQVFTTCTHILTCYILIIKLDLKVFGAAMALNITYGLNFIIQEAYVSFIAWEELKIYSADLLSANTLQGWAKFLKLGIPGTFMQCFEWWAFEILAIFAGILGTVYLGAHVAVINICALTFMIALGL
jgi:MATE family multidrug resistance protein